MLALRRIVFGRYFKRAFGVFGVLLVAAVAILALPYWHTVSTPVQADSYQFSPTGSAIINGVAQQATSQTAANAEGTNAGSWKGTLADDNFHWIVGTNASSGIDAQLQIGGASLNGANKMLIQTEIDTDANLNVLVQVCDWVSNVSVDDPADSQCSNGGWRTLNTKSPTQVAVGITATVATALQWHIYDGYWSTGVTGGTPVSTPLSNFISPDANKQIKVRYYSTTAVSTTLAIDYLRATAFIDSVYNPADQINLGTGAMSGHYGLANAVANSATAQVVGGDNNRVTVAGTVGSAADFYNSYRNVQTYPGMNTIVLRSEYSCSATTTVRPAIWNFTTASWEDLTTASPNCTTTDIADVFSKNSSDISSYISGGEMRIRWRALASGTQQIRLDYAYLMLGSTNNDTSKCEISFGTGTATTCSNTRTIDTETAPTGSDMAITAEDESATMGTTEADSYYPTDIDNDAVAGEEGAAANVSMPVQTPTGTSVVGIHYAARFAGRSAGTTASSAVGLRDYTGLDSPTNGSWTAIGTTSNSAVPIYVDSIVSMTNSAYGLQSNPSDYISSASGMANLRIRTVTDSAAADNNVISLDFAMVSLQWISDANHPSKQFEYQPSSQNLVTGVAQQATSQTASNTEGTNTGSWRATLADDNFHWAVGGASVAPNGTNINAQLNSDGVSLNGANKMTVQTEVDLDATVPNLKVQICDWVSAVSVDNAADAQCTAGGWRTLNSRTATNIVVPYTDTASDQMQWHIYDGYWSTGTTGGTPVSTPLSNFISQDTAKRIKIRYFDNSVNTASVLNIDFLRISTFIDTAYSPASFTNLGSGAASGTYANAQVIGNSATGQQSTSTADGVYLDVAGTAGTAANFYTSFSNVKSYTGMNSLVVKADYRCSATGNTFRPKIWNFTTAAWEDLTTASINCSLTDATSAWAKNAASMADYIKDGEVRIGWRTLAVGTQAIRLDFVYLLTGSTNDDGSKCEISFGSGTASSCANTRTLDMTGTSSVFAVTAEDESATMGTTEADSYYPFDIDNDATTLEEGAASNISLPVAIPNGGSVVGLHYATSFAGRSAGTTGTVQAGLKDYSGFDVPATGSWAPVGATSAAATQTYSDSITNLTASVYGYQANPRDFLSSAAGLVNVRLRNTADSASVDNNVVNWDFVMISPQWIEPSATNLEAYRWFNNSNANDVGTPLAAQDTASITPSNAFRLRMLIGVDYANLPINGKSFKLQAGIKAGAVCDGTAAYADITAVSGAIRYYNNAAVADGDSLLTNGDDPASGTTVAQTYEEANNFTNSSWKITSGESGLWDFALIKDPSAPASTSYCIRAISADGSVLDNYNVIPEIKTASAANNAPAIAASLAQKKIDTSTIPIGSWVNAGSIMYTAVLSDPDASDMLRLCVEKDQTGITFSGTEDLCGTPVAFSGTPVAATVTISAASDLAYHWQALAKDSASAASSWSSFGNNTETVRDFGLDTTAPTGGTVFDGPNDGIDGSFNDGSLGNLSANWSSVNSNASGLQKYEYSIGTSAGGTDVLGWTNNATGTGASVAGLNLQTSKRYYTNLRATDTAGNISSVVSSNGQLVAPAISFMVSPASVQFSNLKSSNNYTDIQSTTLTTSTNAYGGYIVRSFTTDLLRASNGSTIGLFNGGTYAAPDTWQNGDTGFGYTSSDTTIQGANKFNGTCSSGAPPCFAPFSTTAPGDIVADHTSNLSGTPVTDESFTMQYRVTAQPTQSASNYSTVTVYSVTPVY